MTTDKATFRIHLPTLFAKVNEHRRQDGLPPVEPAIMAVRASIKFTLRRQKYLNLNREALDVNKEDAQHLCEALAELFNVSLTPDQGSGNGAPTAGTASIQEPAATRIAPPAASGADPPAQKSGSCRWFNSMRQSIRKDVRKGCCPSNRRSYRCAQG